MTSEAARHRQAELWGACHGACARSVTVCRVWLVVVTVNPTGKVNPYKPNQQGECDPEKCRLPEHVALVESGLVDVVALPEAHTSMKRLFRHGLGVRESYFFTMKD